MTRVAVRLARVEAAVPAPVPVPAYDLSRLKADQLERMAEIQPRYRELGLAGLTDDEVEDLAEIATILKATDLPPAVNRS